MKNQPTPSDHEVLTGLVERVTYQNAENGFCVLRVKATASASWSPWSAMPPRSRPANGLQPQATSLTESESRGPSPIRISYRARFRHRQRGLIWISERQRAGNRDLRHMSRNLWV